MSFHIYDPERGEIELQSGNRVKVPLHLQADASSDIMELESVAAWARIMGVIPKHDQVASYA